tara:strand:+ start:1084 stop:2730 length:1647 start_codon:yes stop_codon:yes gene_type:complete
MIQYFGLKNLFNKLLFNSTITPKNIYIKKYLKQNKSQWDKINLNVNKKSIMITGFVHIPIYYMMGALIGKLLQEKFRSDIVCILEKGDYYGESIYRSFNIKNFIYLKSGNFFYRLLKFRKSIKILSKMRDIDEFLNYKVGSIYFGKIVYDHFLRHTGNCSINTFDFKIHYLFSKALDLDQNFKKIIKDNNFKYCVQSEQQFIPGAISYQNCLEKKIKIFSRNKGPNLVTITKFSNVNEIFTPVDKIDYKFFYKFFRKYQKKASLLGAKIIEDRINGRDNFSQKAWGIKNTNKNSINFKNLKNIYKWKNNNPVVCIFSHLFVDGNFSEGRRLYKDNLTWLRATLEIIKDFNHVNWIVKPHPLEHEYPNASTTTVQEVLRYKKYNHIRLFDDRLSNRELSKNIISTVSSHGTVSLEYACLGIPSIVCGKTKYTKLGFLNDAKTTSQYKKMLKNINKLKRLNKKQISKAKVWVYIGGKLVLVDNEIIPNNVTNQSKLPYYSKKDFWLEAIKKQKKFDFKKSFFKKMFFEQLKYDRVNIINYKFIEEDFKKI